MSYVNNITVWQVGSYDFRVDTKIGNQDQWYIVILFNKTFG